MTTDPDNAWCYGKENWSVAEVLLVEGVRLSDLMVDPEDGHCRTVRGELSEPRRSGYAGYLAIRKPIAAKRFRLMDWDNGWIGPGNRGNRGKGAKRQHPKGPR